MIPLTDTITGAALLAELGLTGPVASLMASAARLRRLTNQPAGTITLSAARGTGLSIGGGVQKSVKTLLGNPAVAGTYRLVVEPGATIGSNNPGVMALDVGQFPSGSAIAIDAYGFVDGAGGLAGAAGAGGKGGTAIHADYPNQTVTITYRTGGGLRAGGGGGGKGGAGGQGGTGGAGVFYTTVTEGPIYQQDVSDARSVAGANTNPFEFRWGGVVKGSGSNGFSPGDGYTYYYSAYQGTTTEGSDKSSYTVYHHSIYRTYQNPNFTNGGAGGGGAAGGNGGRGQGYDGTAAAGSAGSIGAGGAGGGTNAGTGGKGGNGGAGGAGAAFGAAGTGGSAGAQGATGASGNYTGGSAGAGGAAGSGGGAAGSYVVKGTASVTLVNGGGTLAGLLT